MLSILLGASILLIMIGLLVILYLTKDQQIQLVKMLQNQQKDLLNRLMAADPKTYSLLSSISQNETQLQNSDSTSSPEPYYSMSDASILSRVQGLELDDESQLMIGLGE